MTTGELLQKCVAKDHNAWNEFVKRYHSLVVKSINYKLKKLNLAASKVESIDIAQEIFLSIWEKNKLSTVREISCLENWLIIVSLNAVSNYCKNRFHKESSKTLSFEGTLCTKTTNIALKNVVHSLEADAGKKLDLKEITTLLQNEISKFEYKQQLALKFHIYDGKTISHIAQIMDTPQGTVACWLRRGKKQIRDKLRRVS
ncbi:MAG: sigma-70 family RNA polymerase sigma factor [Candidatus Omnitrophota bacterium]